ncbi:MurR/RpiR family transcriptional regulator [Phototrophicus methaneseepsis]|uniref:MurR/RpiR family transcriptional regulator n=1 Tax=Phototrophicus methaneseepsis TaxID=2710758 RepID=A0A7S8EAF5_9CHLR|nr:MurR/RpiR family transcriptional regulator [Phototrophicus methaneseepsis]QPC83319.1 MurR/RpiR family transcriptional regulator [Phototrophicus methaneseepsis]
MNDQGTDVLTHIRTQYDSMSKSQQRVAEFLLTHGLDVVHLSAARIAELVNVNRSTVVRTAQSLGYEGFPDLQADLQDQLLGRLTSQQRLQTGARQLMVEIEQQNNGTAQVLHTMLRSEISTLSAVVHNISDSEFIQAADMIDAAEKVYILGLRNSLPLALNFGMLLRYVKTSSVLEPNTRTIPDQLEALQPEDLLFTITYSRYARETLTAMEYAQSIGSKVITMTDSTLSPGAKRADLALIVPFRLWLYGNSLASYAVLNALFGALLVRHTDEAQNKLDHLDRLYEKFQVYENKD